MKIITPGIGLVVSALMTVCGCQNKPANLLVNGSAEVPGYDSVPPGWQNIDGHWTSAKLDSTKDIITAAQSGNYFFFAHIGVVSILQQDVDVSKFAKEIDQNNQRFILSGYEQTLEQGPLSDQGMLKAMCLDSSKSAILYTDSTDTLMSKTKWQAIADTFSAPPSTRFIRVQLVALRRIGNDDDGYFDNISLSALPAENHLLFYIIAGAIILAALLFYLTRRQRVKPKEG